MFLEKENPFPFLKNENRCILDLTRRPFTVVGSVLFPAKQYLGYDKDQCWNSLPKFFIFPTLGY